ncbi:TetR/AcrR family transcriptional regulator [Virgisporangium ochraceum]|uniref:TetR family transcriptional regulator n=1 Tax=Virgisporangium ochraceum TaxID=65505 RepID=A0A8J4EF98_9ACTN|nr:TetR family transcriptional regulator [Virgisporangium ochraceum]GIJ72521.1 TetR family transcriptional regulator [Virgisporangium ochraceum]
MTDKPKRRYSSELRREQSDTTRQRIADAARDLMLSRGYADTTMGDVAAAAGVAVQTLYTACPGGKAGLAKLVYDTTLAGDAAPVPMSERPAVAVIVSEPDPVRKLHLYARMVAAMAERIAPVHAVLRAAAGGLGPLLRESEAQRRTGTRGPAGMLAAAGALRPGVDTDRAADIIFALTSIEVFERLTTTCGWSTDDYADWLAATLTDALLPR